MLFFVCDVLQDVLFRIYNYYGVLNQQKFNIKELHLKDNRNYSKGRLIRQQITSASFPSKCSM